MMLTSRSLARSLACSVAIGAAAMPACEKKSPPPPPPAPAPTTQNPAPVDDHHHGPTVALGEQTADGFTIKASRDGDLNPGGDAPIDVWITGGAAKVAAVRFWIGTQDAKGSVKARAEIEHDNWHTHAEVPNPLPDASKLWVEIDLDTGAKVLASFDLHVH